MTELRLTLTVKYPEAAGSSKELVAALQRAIEVSVGSGLLGPHCETWTADVREIERAEKANLPMNWTIQRMVGGQAADGPVLHEFYKLDANVKASVCTAFIDLVVDGLMFHHRPTKRSFEIRSVEDFDKRHPEMLKEEE
jgi:hypothetical protein